MDNKKNDGKESQNSDSFDINRMEVSREDLEAESLDIEELENNSNSLEHEENMSIISNNDIHNIPCSDLSIEGEICNICYIDKKDLNILECCKNTKKICNDCLDCLTSPVCPYCRQDLPKSLTKEIKPSSCPSYSVGHWITNESRFLLIDPYSAEYSDSRVLRRQMRRMRRNYYRERHGGGLYSKREKLNYRRTKRRDLRNETRRIVNLVNNSSTNEILDNLSFDDLFP